MLAASLLFASGGLVLKWCDWNPLAINGVRSLFGAAVIAAFMFATHRKLKLNRVVAGGAVAYMAMTTLFVFANRLTAAGNAIVLQYSCPIWIVFLSLLLFHQLPKKRQLISLVPILLGIALFFLESLRSQNWIGDLLALISGFFYAILYMLNSFEKGDALSSVLIGQILTFVCLSSFSIGCSWSAGNVAAVIWLGVMQVGLAYVFFSLATSLISPLQASLINAVEPIVNPALVALWGYERLGMLSLFGAVLVIAGVAYSSLPDSKKSRKRPADPVLHKAQTEA